MIRLANKWDIPQLKELFVAYYQEHFPQYTNVPMENIEKIMTMIISGAGVAIIDDHENNIRGAIIALSCPNIWDPTRLVLTEILFYVKSEFRNGMTGGRLIKKYTNIGDEWKDAGRVVHYTISHTSKLKIDYSRWGYIEAETTWFQ